MGKLLELSDIAREAVEERGALQKPAELAWLLGQVATTSGVRVVVEIGADMGGTLWALRETTAADVFSITLQSGPYSTGRDLVAPDRVNLITGDSHDARTKELLLVDLEGRDVDVLFIDGDHSLDGVLADLADYGPLVRSGGLVVFHDIVEHPPWLDVGVHEVWASMLKGFRHLCASKIVPPLDWGGVGVLRVDEAFLEALTCG